MHKTPHFYFEIQWGGVHPSPHPTLSSPPA